MGPLHTRGIMHHVSGHLLSHMVASKSGPVARGQRLTEYTTHSHTHSSQPAGRYAAPILLALRMELASFHAYPDTV